MFDLFRSRKKAVKYLLGALMMLVALSMVITLIPGWGSSVGQSASDPVAEVGGEAISQLDVRRNVQNAVQARQVRREMIAVMLPEMVEGMVTERALAYQAERMGFQVTREEVVETIRGSMPWLFEDGKFVGSDVYARALAQQNLSIPEFERRVRQQLLVGKLRQLVRDSVVITEAEIEEAFRRREEQIQLQYIEIAPEKLQAEIQVSPEEISQMYEQRKAGFRIPERRTFEVLVLDQARLAAAITVNETQLQRAYNEQKDRFRTQERRRARHILLATAGKSDDEKKAIRQRADELLKQIRGGGDFAALARQNSDDPGSKENGGDLGWIMRGQMVPPFENAVFTLEPKQISDVVETTYGYHIVEVLEKEDAQLRPFEEVRAQLLEEQKRQVVFDRMEKTADQARAEVAKAPAQAREIAAKLGLDYRKFDDRTASQPLPGLEGARDLASTIFASEAGAVTPVLQASESQLAFGVVNSITPSRQAELDEVRDQVRQILVNEKLGSLLEERAKEVLARATASGDLQQAARSWGYPVRSTQEFNRLGAADGIGSAAAVIEGFRLPEGAVFGPVAAGPNRFVCKVIKKTPADMTRLASERANTVEQLRNSKAEQRMDIFEDSVRSQLVREKKVKINEHVIANLVNSYRS